MYGIESWEREGGERRVELFVLFVEALFSLKGFCGGEEMGIDIYNLTSIPKCELNRMQCSFGS